MHRCSQKPRKGFPSARRSCFALATSATPRIPSEKHNAFRYMRVAGTLLQPCYCSLHLWAIPLGLFFRWTLAPTR